MQRNTWVEIDCGVLQDNIRGMQAALGPRTQLIMVVKAEAYGHGMVRVSRCAQACGVRWFIVSRMDEAVKLRAAVPDASILVLGAVWPEDVPALLTHRIVPVLISAAQSSALEAEAARRGVRLPCHVKVDTGMGRLGLPWDSAAEAILRMQAARHVAVTGVCTHFASAAKQGQFAQMQADRFGEVVAACARAGFRIPFQHIANSAAFSARTDWDCDGVRSGILVYGYGGRRAGSRIGTQPVLQWKSRVIQVKDVPAGYPVSYMSTYVTEAATRLAVVDVGYSDGYSRLMSNKGCVLIGGRRAKVVGRVTMNFIIAEVGPGAPVQEGDEVVLLGRQGEEALWADELARWCQTIPYEILTSIRCAQE